MGSEICEESGGLDYVWYRRRFRRKFSRSIRSAEIRESFDCLNRAGDGDGLVKWEVRWGVEGQLEE